MRFHITSNHTPEFCGMGNPGKFPPNPSWPERCKELGIEYLVGGSCRPQHTGFMFVEADEMSKVEELMRPTMGRDECVITPVTER